MWALGRMGRCPHFQVKGASIYENFEGFSLMQSVKLNASMPPSVMCVPAHRISRPACTC